MKHRFPLIIPQSIWERLQAAVKITRRSLTAEILLAIEERLAFLESTFPEQRKVQEKQDD